MTFSHFNRFLFLIKLQLQVTATDGEDVDEKKNWDDTGITIRGGIQTIRLALFVFVCVSLII